MKRNANCPSIRKTIVFTWNLVTITQMLACIWHTWPEPTSTTVLAPHFFAIAWTTAARFSIWIKQFLQTWECKKQMKITTYLHINKRTLQVKQSVWSRITYFMLLLWVHALSENSTNWGYMNIRYKLQIFKEKSILRLKQIDKIDNLLTKMIARWSKYGMQTDIKKN